MMATLSGLLVSSWFHHMHTQIVMHVNAELRFIGDESGTCVWMAGIDVMEFCNGWNTI